MRVHCTWIYIFYRYPSFIVHSILSRFLFRNYSFLIAVCAMCVVSACVRVSLVMMKVQKSAKLFTCHFEMWRPNIYLYIHTHKSVLVMDNRSINKGWIYHTNFDKFKMLNMFYSWIWIPHTRRSINWIIKNEKNKNAASFGKT